MFSLTILKICPIHLIFCAFVYFILFPCLISKSLFSFVLILLRVYSKKGNSSTKPLAYTALVRPKLEYGAVCWDPYREGQVSALNRVQKRAAKFANNIKESGWETLAQRRLVARLCALSRHTPGDGLGKR